MLPLTRSLARPAVAASLFPGRAVMLGCVSLFFILVPWGWLVYLYYYCYSLGRIIPNRNVTLLRSGHGVWYIFRKYSETRLLYAIATACAFTGFELFFMLPALLLGAIF